MWLNEKAQEMLRPRSVNAVRYNGGTPERQARTTIVGLLTHAAGRHEAALDLELEQLHASDELLVCAHSCRLRWGGAFAAGATFLGKDPRTVEIA